ncbi:MAG: GAF domain-containing protein [Chthonomonadaceae bacterium]|nr:GAF domain-containing protein [Chthonomonadaceae bacterium]
MVEFAARFILGTGVLLASGLLGRPSFDPAWRFVAFFIAYSAMGFALERRNMKNPGSAGIIAVLDSGVVAFLLSMSGLLPTFGLFALLPPAYAAFRYGSDPVSMAPIASAWILVASNFFGSGGWTTSLLVQAAGILGIGLLGARKPVVHIVKEVVEVESKGGPSEPLSQDYFDLREKYRELRDHSLDLERRTKRDRILVQLNETLTENGDDLEELAKKLRETLGVDGLTFHSMTQSRGTLVVQAVTGDVPTNLADTALRVPEFASEWQIKSSFSNLASALKSSEDSQHSHTTVLKIKGRIVGVVTIFDRIRHKVADTAETINDLSEALAALVRRTERTLADRRRTRQAETLHSLAVVTQGVDSAPSLCARIVRELAESLKPDHLSISMLEGEATTVLSQVGSTFRALDHMTFPMGDGVAGWVNQGHPEVLVSDARSSETMSRDIAIKQRIGSVMIVPILYEEGPFGFLTVTTNRVHGIDDAMVETLRLSGAELGHALGRLAMESKKVFGLATPSEFFRSADLSLRPPCESWRPGCGPHSLSMGCSAEG